MPGRLSNAMTPYNVSTRLVSDRKRVGRKRAITGDVVWQSAGCPCHRMRDAAQCYPILHNIGRFRTLSTARTMPGPQLVLHWVTTPSDIVTSSDISSPSSVTLHYINIQHSTASSCRFLCQCFAFASFKAVLFWYAGPMVT